MRAYRFFVLLLLPFSSNAEDLRISVDLESAKAIVALLSAKKTTDATLEKTAALFGSQQLIRKVKGYSGAGQDVFLKTLKEMVETGTVKGNDPYDWKGVKASLTQVNALLMEIEKNKERFLSDVVNAIMPYTPAGLTVDAKACFLAGGGALGFTFGGEPVFHVALHKVGNDVGGLKELVAHELYHLVQDAGQQKRRSSVSAALSYYQEATLALIENLWSEGTANLVGETANSNKGKTLSPAAVKNAERRRENFTLFEAILYKSYHDTAQHRYDAYYNICFTTAFDETAYTTGQEMANAIRQYRGEQALADLVTADPLLFVDMYIRICKETDDKKLVRFDASTEAIVRELMALRK